MRVLLGLAALAAMMVPGAAQAQGFTNAAIGATNAGAWGTAMPETRSHERHHRTGRVHRGLPAAYVYSGYQDFGDFDGNRSFDADRWNDWWHERPERAFPRWMTRNSDCARKWYSGDVLTC